MLPRSLAMVVFLEHFMFGFLGTHLESLGLARKMMTEGSARSNSNTLTWLIGFVPLWV